MPRRPPSVVQDNQLFKGLLATAPKRESWDTADEAVASLLLQLTDDLIERSANMQPGQGLAVVYRIAVVNPDGTLEGEPPVRNQAELDEWRRAVLRRDDHACVRCGCTTNLQAHHVKPQATHPLLRLVVDNGETLCVECHAREHPEQARLILSGKGRRPLRPV